MSFIHRCSCIKLNLEAVKDSCVDSYRGIEAMDWFGHSLLQSQIVGYAITTSRIDSLNRMKTLNEGFVFGKSLILEQ